MSDILKKRILPLFLAGILTLSLAAETQIPQAEHRTFLRTFPKHPSKTMKFRQILLSRKRVAAPNRMAITS